MNQDEGGSSQKQGIQLFQPDRQISSTQKKRKTGIALIIAYVLIATGMIAYAFVESEEVEYHADNDLCTKMEQKQTPTETCYRREKNKNYPVFISYGLGLLGILLAPTVRCLCDFVEELCLSRSCDRRSIFKLFKLCFSGISWKAVSVVFLIDTIACVLAKNSFKLGDLMYILGGIGVYPLVGYLLNLNAQSEVNLSRRLEEKGLYPAYTIAWNYYLHYLKNALPIFSESFSDSDTQVQDQGSDRDPKIQLSLKKMILLFPYNGETKKDLVKQDSRFKKITDISEGGYNFPVYGLIFNGKEYKYVIQYAEEVLSTLRMMCIDERVKCIHEGDLEDQVKLLYRTLVSEILSKDDECRHTCILAQTTAENSSNGRLADVIMHNIRVNECVSTPNSKTVQQRETNDTSLSDTNTGPAVSDTLPAKHPHSNLWSQHRQPRRRKCYSFQELTSNNPPDGVDPSKLESYLIDDEFQKIFEMSRDLFSQLPGWKQDILKKAFGLF